MQSDQHPTTTAEESEKKENQLVESPEESSIKDKVKEKCPAGIQVVVAFTYLLALDTIMDALMYVNSYGNIVYRFDFFPFLLAILAVYLAVNIYKGKDWARWLITIGYVLGSINILGVKVLLAKPAFAIVFIPVILFLSLLYTKKANLYFKANSRSISKPNNLARTEKHNTANYDVNARAEEAYKFLLTQKGYTLEKKDNWVVKKLNGVLVASYSLEELRIYTGRKYSWKLNDCFTDKTTDESKYNICIHCGAEVNRDYRACPTCGEHILCTHCSAKLKLEIMPEYGDDGNYFIKICPNCQDYRDQLLIEMDNPNGILSKEEVYQKLLAPKGYKVLKNYGWLVKEPTDEEVIINSFEELKDYTDQKCGLRVNEGDNRTLTEEKYKLCIHCDTKLELDYQICKKCGAEISCTYCGANLKLNNKHCVRCGLETV